MPKKMFVTKCGKICYKVRQLLVVTKCGKKLLQSAAGQFVTKCGKVCYKVRQLLQSAAKIVTKCGSCYKVRQLLQSEAQQLV